MVKIKLLTLIIMKLNKNIFNNKIKKNLMIKIFNRNRMIKKFHLQII